MKRKFYTHYDPPKTDEEVNEGELLVETAGYIPAKQLIEQMIFAGQRLAEFRAEMYDYGPDDEDDGMVDPTRRPNFDMADASMMMDEVESKVISAKKTAAQKAGSEVAENKPAEASGGPSEGPEK